jgi:deazaflavin-dependent oxidoreductase (nitroreductase family)
MDASVKHALERDRTIDITTTGRRSGQSRRIEIWFQNLGGRIYITGSPGRKSWYANMLAHPEFTFHLKQSARADLPARARPITDEAERRQVFSGILPRVGRTLSDLDEWVEGSPLVEVEFQA